MIVRDTAIPLAVYPYSSTSRIVHWLTRHHGKISTLLKSALRPKSPFLGEYELFGTSELLYFPKRVGTLHTAKECALLHPRTIFRTDWRAMQTASCLCALFNKTTPEEAPLPGLFDLYEELLDLTEEYGRSPQFLPWAELRFCNQQGHAPNLENCILCSSGKNLRFCSSQGGVVCADCATTQELPTHESPPDVLAILRNWQQADHPRAVVKTRLSAKQERRLNAILGTFMHHHFNLPLESRNAALEC
ncbi:MAG: DNA repair protein RecO [Verrucomicrobiota bacterium]